MVFQEHGLFPWLTVRQNIALGPKIRGESRRSRNARADEFISLVGLDGFGDHFPHQLSGGMRQRVSLARTLINEPKVLLMDEPFAALDAITRTEMQEFLLSIWGMTGATIVFVTHDVDEALLLADRVFVMSPRPGRLVKELDVSLERPRPHDIVTSAPFIELKKVLRDCLETAISERKATANAR
jgi:NitT/TauT family transport system ATP-binding protein